MKNIVKNIKEIEVLWKISCILLETTIFINKEIRKNTEILSNEIEKPIYEFINHYFELKDLSVVGIVNANGEWNLVQIHIKDGAYSPLYKFEFDLMNPWIVKDLLTGESINPFKINLEAQIDAT